MAFSIRLTEEEKLLADSYAKLHSLSLGEAFKRALFERIEDEYDIAVADEAYRDYIKDGKKSRPDYANLEKEVRDLEKGAVFKHTGNLTFDQIITIAKAMQARSLSRELKGTVKEVLGTCVAVGITVDGKSPNFVNIVATYQDSLNRVVDAIAMSTIALDAKKTPNGHGIICSS